eukprot:486828_1
MDEKLNNNNINLSNVDIQMKKNNLFEQQKKINNDEVKGQMVAEQLKVSNGKIKAVNAMCDNVRITETADGYYSTTYSCSALLLCENEYTKKALLTNGVFDFMDRSKSVCLSVQQRTSGWQIPIIHAPALGQIANYICVPRTETALVSEFRDDDFSEEMLDLLPRIQHIATLDKHEQFEIMKSIYALIDLPTFLTSYFAAFEIRPQDWKYIDRKLTQIDKGLKSTPCSSSTESDSSSESSSTTVSGSTASDSTTESESEDPIDKCEHKNDPIYDDIIFNKNAKNKKSKNPIEKHVLIDEVKDNDDINYKRVKKMDYRKLRKQVNEQLMSYSQQESNFICVNGNYIQSYLIMMAISSQNQQSEISIQEMLKHIKFIKEAYNLEISESSLKIALNKGIEYGLLQHGSSDQQFKLTQMKELLLHINYEETKNVLVTLKYINGNQQEQ